MFRGHISRIKDIIWQKDDLGFFSGSIDGTIYEFRLYDNGNKTHMFTNQSRDINCMALDSSYIIVAHDCLNHLEDDK